MMHKRSKSLEPFNKMEEHGGGPTASDDSATVRPPYSSSSAAQCSTVSVYLTKINGAARLVTAAWNKSLINQSFTISIDAPNADDAVTHKVELKPWPFWSKKGGKALDVGGCDRVDVFWDLRSAKFAGSSSPEPAAGYYVALVCNEEVVLLLGDAKKEAFKRTKSRPSLEDAVLVCRRESVLGRRAFGARTRLDGRRSREHDIVVEIAPGVPRDPEMWVTVDGAVLVHVKNLQWKFRGNETVLVEQAPVQVIWDVHDWVFSGPGSQAAFVFKPGAPPEILEDDGRNGIQDDEGTDFCFFLQAWRME